MATTAEIERVEAKIIAQKGAKSCDKYDYLTAVGCGVRQSAVVWLQVLWTAFLSECPEKANWVAGPMHR